VAIENARLYTRVSRQAQTLAVLTEISRDLSSILDLDELLERIGHLLRRLIDYQMFSILLLNERDQVLETQFAVRFGERYVPIERVPLGRGLVGVAVQTQAPVYAPDVRRDSRYHMVNPLTRSELAVPLVYKKKVIGVLDMEHTRANYFNEDHQRTIVTLAAQIAIAIENARLYHSLEQKAMQIERLKDFSENIVESLKIGVLTVDLEDCIESWNPQLEDLLAISRSEALRRKLHDVLPQDLVAEISSRASSDHVSGIYKFHLNTRAGNHLVVNASIAPLVGKSGARLGRLILLDDITQRVRLEEQMVQTEKLTSLGLLAAGVAHEVNTPLAVISNYIQMLAKQIPSDDPRQKTIERIVKQTFRASEIVNNLLNFSRTGAAEFIEVDINNILEETLTLVQHPFKTAQVNVVKNYREQLPPVLGSITRLQQVFLNLFMNARDAMPQGGMLEVRTATQNGSVEIEVTDTGSGIPPEHLHRIFDPFFTTKATGRGTGLGLSVSYGIIKEHAGKVDVRSTPGKGTSFRLEFPVARKPVHA
jgi:two-component system, NtrC family, sensor kinase